jgi:hypothetical protein
MNKVHIRVGQQSGIFLNIEANISYSRFNKLRGVINRPTTNSLLLHNKETS